MVVMLATDALVAIVALSNIVAMVGDAIVSIVAVVVC